MNTIENENRMKGPGKWKRAEETFKKMVELVKQYPVKPMERLLYTSAPYTPNIPNIPSDLPLPKLPTFKRRTIQ